VTESADRLRELIEHTVRATQPAAALRAMTVLREELDAFERLQVARALDAGQSFGDVARALGISRQAAHRRYRDLAGMSLPDDVRGDKRLIVTSEARAAATLAREEAMTMGSATVGSEHLLLGIIRSRSLAGVLDPAGVTLAEARRCAQPTLVGGAPSGHRALSPYAEVVFAAALREAVRRGDGFVGVDHLLLASLDDPNGGACRTLYELGVEPSALRAALPS
jgi:hypothetical protein